MYICNSLSIYKYHTHTYIYIGVHVGIYADVCIPKTKRNKPVLRATFFSSSPDIFLTWTWDFTVDVAHHVNLSCQRLMFFTEGHVFCILV